MTNTPNQSQRVAVATKKGSAAPEAVRIMNQELGHRIERTASGFELYDGYGYSGTFATEQAACRCYSRNSEAAQ